MQPLELDRVLTLNPGLRMDRLAGGVVALIGERQRSLLSDPRGTHVMDLVDGRRTVEQIIDAARPRVQVPETLYLLQQFAERGYLTDSAPALGREQDAFWHGIGLDAGAVADALTQGAVSVRAVGAAGFERQLTEALDHAGVRRDAGAPIQVIATADYLDPELAAINRDALARGAPWFVVQAVGTMPLIGPLFQPGRGPCWECLAFWMRGNRPVEDLVRRATNPATPVSPPRASLEASIRAACGIAALAIARGIVQREAPGPWLGDRLLALDLASFETSQHAIVRRPQCPACGDPRSVAAISERPIEIRPVEKAHVEDGGYRRQPPRQTYARYRHLVSPLTGPVAYLVPVPGRDTELRAVYASGYLACPPDKMPRSNVFDRGCAGKGRSADQAKVSALCEALERYSGVYQGDEARIRASQHDLGPAALGLGELTNFSDAQLRAARIGGRSADPGTWVPEPSDPAVVIDWAYAWSLTHGARRYVPFVHCYSDAPDECGTRYGRACGNGAAAGTCVEEAVLQGFLELVERDAVGIWWYNRVRRPAIDLRSFDDPYFGALEADYARQGWRIWVLDVTHDLGIPVCVALGHHAAQDRFSIGFGCHLEPHLAVQRSLTELNQLFDPTAPRRAPWDLDRLPSRDYLFPDPERSAVAARDLPRAGGADLRADIDDCIRRLSALGLELVAVNKTRPDVDLAVVQVVVPGLRHFWPRFGPGRLYEVPHRLGWVPRLLHEAELNPVPLAV